MTRHPGLLAAGQRRAAGEPPAAHRDEEGVEGAHLVEELEGGGALAGDDVGVVVGVDQVLAAAGHLGGGDLFPVGGVAGDDARPVALGGGALGRGRVVGHDHGRRGAEEPRRQRQALGMVPGGVGDDAPGARCGERRLTAW